MIVHQDWESLKIRGSVSHLLSKHGGIWVGGYALLRRLACFSERLYVKKTRFNEENDHFPFSDPLSGAVRYHVAELGFVVLLVTRHFICVLEVLFLTAFLLCVLEWMYSFWNPLFFIDVIAICFDSICHVEYWVLFFASSPVYAFIVTVKHWNSSCFLGGEKGNLLPDWDLWFQACLSCLDKNVCFLRCENYL